MRDHFEPFGLPLIPRTQVNIHVTNAASQSAVLIGVLFGWPLASVDRTIQDSVHAGAQ